MSKSFNLTIRLGSAEMQTGQDVARALRDVAANIYGGVELGFEGPHKIFDANGNTVGSFGVQGADDLGTRT